MIHEQSCCFAHKISFFLRFRQRYSRGGCSLLMETDESTWGAGIFISQRICSVFSRITTCDAAAEPATRRLRGRCAGGVALIVKIVRRPKWRHFSRMVRAFLPKERRTNELLRYRTTLKATQPPLLKQDDLFILGEVLNFRNKIYFISTHTLTWLRSLGVATSEFRATFN